MLKVLQPRYPMATGSPKYRSRQPAVGRLKVLGQIQGLQLESGPNATPWGAEGYLSFPPMPFTSPSSFLLCDWLSPCYSAASRFTLPQQLPPSSPTHVPKRRAPQVGQHQRQLPAPGSSPWGHSWGGGMLNSFGKPVGKGNAGLGLDVARNEEQRKEEAGALANSPDPKSEPATADKPHCAMLGWALKPAGSIPWAARGGNHFSCFPHKETKAQRGREPAQGPQVSQLWAREQRFPTLIVLNTLLWAPLSLALH